MHAPPNSHKDVPVNTRLFTAILANILKRTEDTAAHPSLNKALEDLKEGSYVGLKQLRRSEKIIFDRLHREYLLYKHSFSETLVLNPDQSKETAKNIEIDEYLIEIQQKVKLDKPGPTYQAGLVTESAKWQLQPAFRTKWLEIKSNLQKQTNKFLGYFTAAGDFSPMDAGLGPSDTGADKKTEIQPKIEYRPQPLIKIEQPKPIIQPVNMASAPKTIKRPLVSLPKPVSLQSSDVKIKQEQILRYLIERKDLNCTEQNSKEIAVFLHQELERFMKNVLQQSIRAALLRNNRVAQMPLAGDEFRYYSKDNTHLNCEIPKVILPPLKIKKVTYRSKLEIYSEVRFKEAEFEESLVKTAEKRRESDKRTDKKLWDYLMRNSATQEKRQWIEEDRMEDSRLLIDGMHVQMVLESYPFFRNSHIMFFCYNC